MTGRRTVITGVGVLCSLGTGAERAWSAILAGEGSVRWVETEVRGHRWRTFPVHAMAPFDARDHLDDAGIRYLREAGQLADLDLVYLAAAAAQAVRDADLDGAVPGDRTALVLAHENPGVGRLIEELWQSFFDDAPPAGTIPEVADALVRRHRSAFFHLQSFAYVFHVAKLFAISGHTLMLNNACASGLYALDAAHRLIQTGRADAAIVAASDRAAQTPKFLWFDDQGLYSPSGAARPFDRDRDGLVLGEAGAAVVVEDLERARRRGAPIYGEYLGGAFGQETWRITLPDVASKTYARIIRAALDATATPPEAIDLVVPHGTGTALADRYEADAVASALGGPLPPAAAFKGAVGHTLGCCALLETVFALLALRDGVVPPTHNHRTPDPAIRLAFGSAAASRPLRTVLRTVNAFGGFDAAAVLRRVEDR